MSKKERFEERNMEVLLSVPSWKREETFHEICTEKCIFKGRCAECKFCAVNACNEALRMNDKIIEMRKARGEALIYA